MTHDRRVTVNRVECLERPHGRASDAWAPNAVLFDGRARCSGSSVSKPVPKLDAFFGR
jgi:hypothetical protein